MISLEGLTLTTGRVDEARDILRTFAFYFRDGLIPNLFPEGNKDGLYNTADATLWFFQALHRYVQRSDDWATVRHILPKLDESVGHHLAGTRFNIGVDPGDGLLRQGADNFALTWMDAKMGDWVVTPRRGKAVEINALWYNALCLLGDWHERLGDVSRAAELRMLGARTYESFNRRFWFEDGQHLYDVVDGENGDDAACRPNQIFSFALEHPVLGPSRWHAVLDIVEARLLTPLGLRSLDPRHPDYRSTYIGDLRSRDGAYHQGTVWGWLIGPFVDAWIRAHPDRPTEARKYLTGILSHLDEACVGSISEISSTLKSRTRRAAASPRRGASRKCSAAGSKRQAPWRTRPPRLRSRRGRQNGEAERRRRVSGAAPEVGDLAPRRIGIGARCCHTPAAQPARASVRFLVRLNTVARACRPTISHEALNVSSPG